MPEKISKEGGKSIARSFSILMLRLAAVGGEGEGRNLLPYGMGGELGRVRNVVDMRKKENTKKCPKKRKSAYGKRKGKRN